jgi:hypothetical protein
MTEMVTKKSEPGKSSTRSSSSATKKQSSSREAPSSRRQSRASKDSGSSSRQSTRASAPRAEPKRRKSGTAIAAEAARQLLEVTGREVEGVTALERSDDGWMVQVEVIEVRRIPDTTDVLGLYEVEVDSDGVLLGYRRQQRYVRGTPGDGGGR